MADILIELDQKDHKDFNLGQKANVDINIGEVKVVNSGGISFEETPVDSGFVWYNEETKKYQTREVDLSGKLDKVSTQSSLQQLYSKNINGTQTMVNMSSSMVGSSVVQRQANSHITVPREPQAETDATAKKYVDDNFVSKTTEALKIYGTDSQGNQVQWIFRNTNNTKNTVAGRDSNGNIQVGSAINGTDAVNKQYAEDNFVKSTSEARKIYGTDENGSSAEYNLVSNTYTANSIAQRSATGTIATADPQWGNDATNKRYVDDKFNGANKAVSFVNYSAMISSLNTLPNNSYNVGQNIMIVTLQVPDLWVSEVAEESVAYTYVSDTDFVNELTTNGSVHVGYYKLSALETQKVDLTDYATVSQVNSKVQKVPYSKDQTFADGSDAGAIGRLYMRFRDNTENSIVANCQNVKYTVPVRDANGNFYVGNPIQQYHTTTKKYVDESLPQVIILEDL